MKKYNKLEIASLGFDGIRELEIDGDYIIDVKKSDSLIFPFIGEIKLKRRELYTGQINGKQFYKLEAPWTTVTIECVFEDGGWKEKNKEEGTFNLIRKGKQAKSQKVRIEFIYFKKPLNHYSQGAL